MGPKKLRWQRRQVSDSHPRNAKRRPRAIVDCQVSSTDPGSRPGSSACARAGMGAHRNGRAPCRILAGSQTIPGTEDDAGGVAVERAVAAFMADSRDCGNSEATLHKKGGIFERRMARDPKNRESLVAAQTTSLLRYCDHKGIRFLAELDLNAIRDWRATWKVNSLVRQKRQGQVLGFLWFCERAGWLPWNYASDITRGLGRILVKATQTGYFQPREYKAVIDATYLYSDRPSIDKHNSLLTRGHSHPRTTTRPFLRPYQQADGPAAKPRNNAASGYWSAECQALAG
jgi:hypothetical protein